MKVKLTMRHAQFAVLGLVALLAAFGLLPGDVLAGIGIAGVAMGEVEIKDLPKLTEELKKQVDDVKAIAEDFKGKMAAGDKISTDAKTAADEALTKMNTLKVQVEELQKKVARIVLPAAGGGNPDDPDYGKSLGTRFIESEGYKKLAESPGQRGKAEIAVKATLRLDNVTPDTAGNAGMLVEPTRLPGIQQPLRRRLVVRDLLAQGQMTGNSIEYLQETGFTNNANMVAEEAAKPQSDIQFDERTTSARVIAHYMKATRQILSDAPQLRSIIDERLLYGLALKEEQQLLNGDGTGQNLLGIIPQSTAYAAPGGLVAGDAFGTLRLAMLQAVLAEYPASGHVMNPIDWTRLELLKDDIGRYIIGNPQGSTQPTLWNLPVVVTQAITQDKFLTGAFRPSAQVFDRWQARVELATENEDDFIKNRVTILAEERLALVVYRPEGFIYGDLGFIA